MSTTGSSQRPSETPHHPTSFWLWVMCLTGVDYFSTLGYQPSIAAKNTGALAPLATIILVLVTLFGALPVYRYVAGRSFTGQGSIGMLARLVSGWPGKILVLVMLGFAATDFVITKTLSAADAAEHAINNPNWPFEHDTEGSHRQLILVTMTLLVLLGATFLRGFKEVIGLAVLIVGVYLTLNLIVIGSGLAFLAEHPEKLEAWWTRVREGQWYLESSPLQSRQMWATVVVCLILFPKLALGLSGFETGVAVMALVKGDSKDSPTNPVGRIRNTRKLLLTAALIMSTALFTSSLVVSTLIPPEALLAVDAQGQPLEGKPKLPANNRALAYLAHAEDPDRVVWGGGEVLGTIYDISTIVILWFAGASAMAGLLNLVPQYLPKYGMAPEWARAVRPLVLLFTAINLGVTWIFEASVDAQGDAYATGVLMLMTSGCVAVLIDIYRTRQGKWYQRISLPFALITLLFVYTTLSNIIEKPTGIQIASFFILTILITSLISRIVRSRELRFSGFHIPDPESLLMWDAIRHLELSILVPHRPGRRSLEEKEAAIRRDHRLPPDIFVIFVEVELSDASEFTQTPTLQVRQEQGRFVMKISNAASIAHTLAAVALEMAKVGKPPEIHFGWTDETPLSGTLGFILFGEGNVPWMVRELIRKAEPDPAKRPLIILAGT